MSAMVAQRGFQRAEIVALLADYSVLWDNGMTEKNVPPELSGRYFEDLSDALPPQLAARLAKRWEQWLARLDD
jgi:hypothetical protein